ncbi:MAG: hypothetical protein K2L21_05195 [Muribaculaceae bacterium]|nr:hypothetical protein [Muribaculaceae bacterium]
MPDRITKFLHSRYAALPAGALMIAAAWSTHVDGSTPLQVDAGGIALPPAFRWIADADVSTWVALACNVAIMAALIILNNRYNLLRSMTMLAAVLFAAMQCATPHLTARFYTGPLLALVVCGCIGLMFGSYAQPEKRRQIFLVFFLLSAGMATQYAYAVYIPLMLLGCWQMRIMTARAAMAAIIGLITPWWLLLGLGIVHPADIRVPEPVKLLSYIDFSEGMQLGTAVVTAAVVFTASVALDFFRTIAYNARSRSYNGMIVLTGFITILAMAIDYNNVACYIPLMNVCAALQAAQFFVIHRSGRSWMGIAGLITVYISLYIWTMVD